MPAVRETPWRAGRFPQRTPRADVELVYRLHRQLFRYTDGGGGQLKTEENLIASYKHGHREILFTPPSPKETSLFPLVHRYRSAPEAQAAHPILLIAGFVLDFLAIHPVADGNGRLARLLTTYQLLDRGHGVARYVSIEQRMFDTKNACYSALCESQRRWHRGTHDVWPWIEYLVGILEGAYDDLEARVAARRGLSGLSKQERVREYVLLHAPVVFRLRDVRAALPGVSDPTIAARAQRAAPRRVGWDRRGCRGSGPRAAMSIRSIPADLRHRETPGL